MSPTKFIQSAPPSNCRYKEDAERLKAELEAEKHRLTTELEGVKTAHSHDHATMAEELERVRALHEDVNGRLTDSLASETNAKALLKEVKLEV
jgi:hypothetical protein